MKRNAGPAGLVPGVNVSAACTDQVKRERVSYVVPAFFGGTTITAKYACAHPPLIFRASLNLAALTVTHDKALSRQEEHMKIALLALLGLALGALGGAAVGIGAGLAWVEIFKTTSFEGYSSMLVFFTFMPAGAAIGAIGGALLFGMIAIKDAEIAIERQPAHRQER